MGEMVQESHADRIAWYCGLLEEWTGRAPCAAAVGGTVVVSVDAYRSPSGVEHAPMAVCGATCEHALESLANAVYRSLHEESQRLEGVDGGGVWEPGSCGVERHGGVLVWFLGG